MNRNEYCDRVLAQVGRLTSDEANDLRNELAGHIEDHAEALVEHGYTEVVPTLKSPDSKVWEKFHRTSSSTLSAKTCVWNK